MGLAYLALDRSGDTLSGGETQRIRLAAQLGSNLRGVCYILDEPTIGLHPVDNQRLLASLNHLKRKGNTIIIMEHDAETMRRADTSSNWGRGPAAAGGGSLLGGASRLCVPNRRPSPENGLADPSGSFWREWKGVVPGKRDGCRSAVSGPGI